MFDQGVCREALLSCIRMCVCALFVVPLQQDGTNLVGFRQNVDVSTQLFGPRA